MTRGVRESAALHAGTEELRRMGGKTVHKRFAPKAHKHSKGMVTDK